MLTPLWVVSLFVTLTEVTLGVAVGQTEGGVQIALAAFVLVFPVLVAASFFAILWARPWVFYSPNEYGRTDASSFIQALRGIPKVTVTETEDLGEAVATFGDPDRFQLLFKANGKTWEKSTKAMQLPGGCLVQVSTDELNPDGSRSVAEALAFVPGVRVVDEAGKLGRYLDAASV
jgi:hypothetical protein